MRRLALLVTVLAAIGLSLVVALGPPGAGRQTDDERQGAAPFRGAQLPTPADRPDPSIFPVPPILPGLPPPPQIPADCSRDVTAELNAWIARAPQRSTLTFARNGCYRTESTVLVEDKNGVTFEGNGATFRRTQLTAENMRYPEHSPHWRIVKSSDLTFRNLRVEGTNSGPSRLREVLPGGRDTTDAKGRKQRIGCEEEEEGYGCFSKAFAFEHGFHIGEVNGVTLEHAIIDAVWGDGIYVGLPVGSTNVRIIDVTIDRNGRQGVAIGKASGVLMDSVRVLHSYRAGVDLEPTSPANPAIEGVEIRNSMFRSRLRALAAGGRGGVNDIYYHDNRILDSALPWVDSESGLGMTRFGWRIHNNVYEGAVSQHALRFVNTKDVDIRGNVMRYESREPEDVVRLFEGAEAVIACNWFQGATDLVTSDATSRWIADNNSLTDAPPACLPGGGDRRPG